VQALSGSRIVAGARRQTGAGHEVRGTNSAGLDLLRRIDRFYDAVPRLRARSEALDPFVLFVRTRPGHSYYARPLLGFERAKPSEILRLRARQRELGEPEALEWVHEIAPALLGAAEAAGLVVTRAPIMVLDPAQLRSADGPSADAFRLLSPAEPRFAVDLALSHAVTGIGFGTRRAPAPERGVNAEDVLASPVDKDEVEREAGAVLRREAAYGLCVSENAGALASGAYQRLDGVAEIVAVTTIASARRQGRGAAVTALLCREALATGAELVFLSAASDEIARMYGRIGFRRVGTACIASPRTANVPPLATA
jgi:hypothetical protein